VLQGFDLSRFVDGYDLKFGAFEFTPQNSLMQFDQFKYLAPDIRYPRDSFTLLAPVTLSNGAPGFVDLTFGSNGQFAYTASFDVYPTLIGTSQDTVYHTECDPSGRYCNTSFTREPGPLVDFYECQYNLDDCNATFDPTPAAGIYRETGGSEFFYIPDLRDGGYAYLLDPRYPPDGLPSLMSEHPNGSLSMTIPDPQQSFYDENINWSWQDTPKGATDISISGNDGFIHERSESAGVWSVAAPVPEPAEWVLMLLGFGSLGGVLRRRQAIALAA
jgi:hypothetical protein